MRVYTRKTDGNLFIHNNAKVGPFQNSVIKGQFSSISLFLCHNRFKIQEIRVLAAF